MTLRWAFWTNLGKINVGLSSDGGQTMHGGRVLRHFFSCVRIEAICRVRLDMGMRPVWLQRMTRVAMSDRSTWR